MWKCEMPRALGVSIQYFNTVTTLDLEPILSAKWLNI